MNVFLNFLLSVNWGTVFVYLGGGTALAIIAQLLKRVLGLNSEKVIQFLVVGVAALISVIQYILVAGNLPPVVMGIHTATLIGIAQPLYIYFLKPFSAFLGNVKAYQLSQNAATANPIVPAGLSQGATVAPQPVVIPQTPVVAQVEVPATAAVTTAPATFQF
jgi:hypothetical protein